MKRTYRRVPKSAGWPYAHAHDGDAGHRCAHRHQPPRPGPRGTRTAADVVTPQVVAQLTRDVVGSGRTANHAPFTGEKLADLPESTPEDVADAFARARAAQEAWAATPVARRAAVLLRFHDLVLARQAEVLDLIQVETGKARLHAHEEVQAVALAARHYGRKALVPAAQAAHRRRPRPDEDHRAAPAARSRRPDRAVELPLRTLRRRRPALLVSGNAVVMKPDTETALTALWGRDLLIEAGLPAEVFQVVVGEGQVVGTEVVRHADYVSFTGSTTTGKIVAQRAAARLIGCSLELGGKNAMLVLEDADIEKAAAGAVRACFSSAGQLCISIERLLVHESVADAFLERFTALTKAMRLGNSLAYGADMGSLAGERQFEAVRGHVEEAVAKGAKVLAAWAAPAGHRPVLLRADHPGRRRGGHGGLQRRDLRPGRLRLPLPRRGGGDHPRQRHLVRPQLQRLDQGRPPRPGDRRPPAHRHRQRQRGVRLRLRLGAGADGRHEGVRDRAPATGPRASSSTPSRRPSPTSGCCRWPRRSAWTTPSTPSS